MFSRYLVLMYEGKVIMAERIPRPKHKIFLARAKAWPDSFAIPRLYTH